MQPQKTVDESPDKISAVDLLTSKLQSLSSSFE